MQSAVYLFMWPVYLWQVERCPELLDVIVEEFLPTSWRMLGVLLFVYDTPHKQTFVGCIFKK